jgi:ketosteroid isomerase-like protein
VIVFGPRVDDAMATRAQALVALGKVVDSKARTHAKLRSGGLDVVVSPGGHSAWMVDTLTVEGRELAVTAVLTNTGDLWAVSAAAIASPPAARALKAESGKDALVPPGGAAAGKVTPGTEPVIEKFRAGLLDPEGWGELAARSDAVAIGPAAGQIARGKPAIKKLWAQRAERHVRAATTGDFTTGLTPDGQLAWLSVAVTRAADDEDPLPLRVFAIYERDAQAWKLIALHEAVAVGEPGAGAPFKKILPPAPAPEPKVEPAKPAEAKPADAEPAKVAKKTKKATKRKKARKKKPADDEQAKE